MEVGARPEKWEGTGWGVVSEEEPGWTVLFRAPLLGFFCPLQTRWAHPEAEAAPLRPETVQRRGGLTWSSASEPRERGIPVESQSPCCSPPHREPLQERGTRSPLRWPLSVWAPPGPRADAGAPLSSRPQRLFTPAWRWGAAGRR